ncbi:phosphopantothenoylcysteine decarboxylase [Mariprofundus ferrinatatus]|uniref:Coenzyme A biosynthesis bifunctional protein CoaBC n=1 Tax=Mariprofundus ferrinatatus TaxID=1921087 RepID=A0A2K8L8Z3_9PROT|nr:bifunctional phosphopantothenoylcysteine decarboxylase/phosphopantothenate--cysteine ligase CoaBC [Mariprofundus ferrinatatus]ATX81394.1 phosphopantothenoylcysteine decarboxylase [Mariprofundus ferrinatatus]
MLAGKRILIGIGGGIAVYRVAELVRLLIKAGAEVRCVMTRSACQFVSPLTFEALTGKEVHTELFDLTTERNMGHIQLARWADAVVIAPATANILARLAYGIADDLLTTMMQVNKAPTLLAPAMNSSMWESDATRRNVEALTTRGIRFIGPESGQLACGEEGSGRLSEPENIVSALLPLLTEQTLQDQRWVINAGPTAEAWDAVRLLTNRASGKLGALLASAAAVMGAEVALIAGPGTPDAHPLVKRINVTSADEMLAACIDTAKDANTFIATAAVSDFRFQETHSGKLKRNDTKSMNVELIANPDIVAEVAAMYQRPSHVIAFAAESSNHTGYARSKLEQKGVDAIVANDIGNMGSERAGGWWVTAEREVPIDSESKQAFAEQIIQHIMELES